MVTIIIIVLSFYLLGKLLKWLLPIYIMNKARKFNEQNFAGQYNEQNSRNTKSNKKQKEGSVTVEVNENPAQKIDKNLGDYVEYVEEINPETKEEETKEDQTKEA